MDNTSMRKDFSWNSLIFLSIPAGVLETVLNQRCVNHRVKLPRSMLKQLYNHSLSHISLLEWMAAIHRHPMYHLTYYEKWPPHTQCVARKRTYIIFGWLLAAKLMLFAIVYTYIYSTPFCTYRLLLTSRCRKLPLRAVQPLTQCECVSSHVGVVMFFSVNCRSRKYIIYLRVSVWTSASRYTYEIVHTYRCWTTQPRTWCVIWMFAGLLVLDSVDDVINAMLKVHIRVSGERGWCAAEYKTWWLLLSMGSPVAVVVVVVVVWSPVMHFRSEYIIPTAVKPVCQSIYVWYGHDVLVMANKWNYLDSREQ